MVHSALGLSENGLEHILYTYSYRKLLVKLLEGDKSTSFQPI